MNKKTVSGILLTLLLMGMLTLAFNIQPVKSDWTWTETIYIRADGSIEPDTAPISNAGNITYTLTDNIVADVPQGTSAIVVERDNIAVDGAGYTVQGTGAGYGMTLSGRSNVTIRNMNIDYFRRGVFLSHSSNNTITANNLTDNTGYGITLYISSNNNIISSNNIENNGDWNIWVSESSSNVISQNNISNKIDGYGGVGLEVSSNSRISENTVEGRNTTHAMYGICLMSSQCDNISQNKIACYWEAISLMEYCQYINVFGNSIADSHFGVFIAAPCESRFYHNNFLNNALHVYDRLYSILTWDNGCEGNFWSDYGGADSDGDGIGDTPYVIDENNQDNYPLMSPYIVGDINHNGFVDIYDLAAVGKAYGSQPGDSNWNCHCDITGSIENPPRSGLYPPDGVVSFYDLETVVNNYGKSYSD